MNFDDKFYVAGHTGMVGSSILNHLKKKGFTNIITRSSKDLNLIDQDAVNQFFEVEQPKYVILSAAHVGGIHANNKYPADFIYKNLMIEINVIHAAYINKVERLLFLGSSCIYPKITDQPMSEISLLDGKLEPTNEPYAIAKIAGIKMCESYNRQYGTDFRSVMPCNLYGNNDDFRSIDSHVVPALIRRFHEAKINNLENVIVWGTGKAQREFLHVNEMTEASLLVFHQEKSTYNAITDKMLSHVNIGSGQDVSILELAEIIKKIVSYKGKIKFDPSFPDGSPRKLLDISKVKKMGWINKTSLEEGLTQTYKWFLENVA